MPNVMKLESLSGETPQEIIEVDSGSLTIGRDTENAIVVDSDSVSRIHACVFEVQGSWLLRDLNSTNGTQVNGVKVQPGQFRMLRHGDLVQLANFPMRFTELHPINHESEDGVPPPTLLVFNGDHFEADFPLATPGARFLVGGAEGHLFLEPPGDATQLEIAFHASHLEMTVIASAVPIIVNGMSVGGVTTLSDRDEIDIESYKIIVNDPASARTSKENRMIAALQAQPKRPGAPQATLGTNEARPWEWESDVTKKKLMSGRKFVFGTNPEEDDVSGTVAMTRQEMAFKTGEIGAAQRFSQSAARMDTVKDPDSVEKRQMIMGAIVLVLLIGVLVYFFLG